MTFGFLFTRTAGCVRFFLLRPDSDLTATAGDEYATILILGRLHYRNDVLARLPAGAARPGCTDAELVLAVFRTQGPTGLERLEGEFSLLVWDETQRRAYAQRDPFGAWPLYWHADQAGLAVSNSLQALADLLPACRFDPEHAAAFLMQPYLAAEVAGERTALTGVRRVRPGAVVELDETGRAVVRARWDWRERIAGQPAMAGDDAGERFRDLLRAAVEQRLGPGQTAAHLSGGMDSSAVVCLAQEALRRAGAAPLLTLSLVYNHPSLLGERRYIELVLADAAAAPVFLAGDEISEFDWFSEAIPVHDEPYGGLASLATLRCFARASAQGGARTVLSGLGSDEIVDSGPYHLADLLRRGRWLAAWREAGRWATAWNTGVWSLLRRYGLEPILPILAREGLGALWRGRRGRWPTLGWFTIPPWVRPDFARRHDLAALGRAHARRLFAAPTPLSQDLNMLAVTAGDWGRWYITGPLGINASHPFRDPRLVCFALALPFALRVQPGRTKPVLRKALHGVVPEPIRARLSKRGFDDVYGPSLARHRPQLEQMIRDSAGGDLGIFESGPLLDALRQASLGVGDVVACERLDATLALIAWYDGCRRRPLPPAREVTPGSPTAGPAANGRT